ncbi:MAG: hypothetical protein WCQ95_05585 [Bacteroidota bacterium]
MRKIFIYFGALAIISLLSSCSGSKDARIEPGSITISNDLENTGWINQYTLVKDVAHSGKISSKIDSITQYSFGYSEKFKNISDTLPKSVDFSVWVYFPQTGINGSLVYSIDSVGKNIFWKGIPLKDSVKAANQWKEIKTNIELPRKIMPTDKISIYVWNPDKKTFYVDDMKIIFHNQ